MTSYVRILSLRFLALACTKQSVMQHRLFVLSKEGGCPYLAC